MVDKKKLRATTDAQVWAQEFMAEFSPRREDIDEGLMIGWFANAMSVAERTADGAVLELLAAIDKALHELGVPNESYPAPVANAVAILRPFVADRM